MRRSSLDRATSSGIRTTAATVAASLQHQQQQQGNDALPPLVRGPTGATSLQQQQQQQQQISSVSRILAGASPPAGTALERAMNINTGIKSSSQPMTATPQSSSSSTMSAVEQADTVTALRTKMEKQRAELDLRTDNVNAIQRNFQRLSEMYAADRQRLQEFERNAKQLQGEVDSLRAEQKLFRALQAEYASLKNQHSAAEKEHEQIVRSLQTEITSLKREMVELLAHNEKLKDQLAKLQSSADKDTSFKDKLNVALLGCEKALAETISQVVESEKQLKSEIRSMSILSSTSSGSSSSSQQFDKQIVQSVPVRDADAVGSPVLVSTPSFGQLLQEQQQQQQHVDSNNNNSAAVFDTRLRNHGTAIKNFSSTLSQKLAAMTQLLASNKMQQEAAIQAHAAKVSDMMLQLQRVRDELKAAETASNMNRSVAGEAARQAAEEKKILQGELQRLRRELAETKLVLLQEHECSVRSSQVATVAFDQLLEHNTPWLHKKHELAMAQMQRKYEAEAAETAARWKSDRDELNSLKDMMKQQMGDQMSRHNSLENQTRELKQQVASLQQQLTAAQHAGKEQFTKNQQLRQLLLSQQELTQRSQLALDLLFFSTPLIALSSNRDTKLIRQLRTQLDEARDETLAEQNNHKNTQDNLSRMEQMYLTEKSKGSESESQLQRESREKDLQLSTLRKESTHLTAQLEAANSKVGALNDSLKTVSEQLRLAKEAESRALSLHAQSVGEADRAKNEMRRLEQIEVDLRRELAETRQRSELLSIRVEQAEKQAREQKKELEAAVKAREVETATRVQNETQLSELREWANQLRQLHSQSITTVKKILAAEEACESGYSCCICLELMKDPLVLAPCGHSCCRGCYVKANSVNTAGRGKQLAGDTRSYCSECKSNNVTCAVPSAALDMLSGKFQFRCNALKELQTVLERSTSFKV